MSTPLPLRHSQASLVPLAGNRYLRDPLWLVNVIENMPGAMLALDQTGRILLFNRCAEQVFRCTAATMLGRSIEHLVPVLLHHLQVDCDNPRRRPLTLMAARTDGTPFVAEVQAAQLHYGEMLYHTLVVREQRGASLEAVTAQAQAPVAPQAPAPASNRLSDVVREHLLRVLQNCGWVIEGKRGAAHALGLKPSTLRYRMRILGISKPRSD